ncbi:Kelch repeat type 1 [Dillenia turbinata]|uniref:Kelch repeat type 1 n=1 Tax=Dillenia turbinata TaxID=194707 RepID=A0AAN8UZE1_9MAGN
MEEIIPGLPDDIGLECLTRLPYTAHPLASRVCRRWQELLESQEFYNQKKQKGHTRKLACLVQLLPVQTGEKPVRSPVYGVSVFDQVSGTWERVDSVPKYPDGLPMFCQLASSEGKLVLMGGWNPVSYEPVRDVFVYDFVSRLWRQGKDMPSKRSFFAIGALDGRVYVAGGHDENKNALKSVWCYDVREDEWIELGQMSEERDECEGVMTGNEFWVVSGYTTDSQGVFGTSAEAYDLESGQWKRVDGAWKAGRCPRSCVGVGKDGRFLNWAESDSAVRVGTFGLALGDRTLVTGSAYQGAPQGFYVADTGSIVQNNSVKLVKIVVPDEFSGFVQSGCCAEI